MLIALIIISIVEFGIICYLLGRGPKTIIVPEDRMQSERPEVAKQQWKSSVSYKSGVPPPELKNMSDKMKKKYTF